MKSFSIISLFLAFCAIGAAQGIQDSVFRIAPVEVLSKSEFEKEHAGLKTMRLDTAIMDYQLTSDLSVLLNENTSIIIKDYGRGALSTASFRGTAPSHTAVTWNGININSPMLGMVDFTLIPMFIIDELELQHGAASVTSDGGALGGLIEIRNQADWSKNLSGKAYAGFGSFATSHAYTRIDAGNKSFRSSTRLYSELSRNNYPFVNKNIITKDSVTGELAYPWVKNKNAAYSKMGLSQEFYLKLGDNNMIANHTWFQNASRSIPTVLSNEYTPESLTRENLQTDRTLKHVTEFSHYAHKTKIRMRSGIDIQRLNYTMQSQVVGYNLIRNVNSASRMFGWYNALEAHHEFSDRLSLKFKSSLERHHISTLDSASHSGFDKRRNEEALFGGLYYKPAERIHVAVQLRKEFSTTQRIPLIYVAGITFQPVVDKQVYLKANYSRNYHIPTLNDLYWQPGGNPELQPEKSHTSEAGIDFIASSGQLEIKSSLTGFYSDISNWILWLPGFKGYWEPVNIDHVRSSGIEYHLNVTAHLGTATMRLFGNLAWTETRKAGDPLFAGEEETANQLPFIPRISGNLNMSFEVAGYYLVWQNNSMGKRYLMNNHDNGIDTDNEMQFSASVPERSYILYPHYLNSLTLGKAFRPRNGIFTLELDIENLFNETYRNILQRFMPGRSFLLNLKYDF